MLDAALDSIRKFASALFDVLENTCKVMRW